MSRLLLLLISILVMSVMPGVPGWSAEMDHETPLLRDGYVMNGVDGSLIGPDSNDVWLFKLTSDVNDYRTTLKAGTMLELLPSATLEKMIADNKTRETTAYRLWNSRVTKYKGKNFIFPGYFMPLSKPEKAKPESSQDPNRIEPEQPPVRESTLLDEPNDVLSIPPEIVEKLRARREKPDVSRKPAADSNDISVDKPQPATEETLPDVQNYSQISDSIFVNRIGFIIEQDHGRHLFAPDALGRNVQKLSLNLLPCAALELTEQKQAAEPEKMRFKVSGIMTKYKGKNYLLLENATRTYSHGNFGR